MSGINLLAAYRKLSCCDAIGIAGYTNIYLFRNKAQYAWRGTFARLFQFKPGIALSWFPGRELIFSQIANALPTGLKKRIACPCGSSHYFFRLSPFGFFPCFCPPFRVFPQCPHCHFLLFPLSECFPPGNHPWTQSIFLSCNGLAPLQNSSSSLQ